MDHAIVSAKNSTTTPLGFTTTWSGAAELVLHFASIIVLIQSDVASDVDGIVFGWTDTAASSSYLTNPKYTYRLTDDQGNPTPSQQVFVSPRLGAYLTLGFAKSALEEQASFRVTTILSYAPVHMPVERIRDYLDRERTAMPVKAYPANTNLALWASTITSGGVSQQVCPARAGRTVFKFQNQSDTTMYLDERGGTASTADLEILPHAYYEMASPLSPSQINVYCATTGKAYWAEDG